MNSLLIKRITQQQPISATDAGIMEKYFEWRLYKEGESLFAGDSICRELFFIVDGVLRIVNLTKKGNNVIHFFLREGRFCTILNSFNSNITATESIEAACDTEVLTINRAALNKLYTELPYLENVFNEIIQQGLLEKVLLRNSYMGLDLAEKYNLFLKTQPEVAARVSLTDVASYLGIVPQSLSRIRRIK